MPSAKFGRQSVSTPVIGPSIAGPAITFALRARDPSSEGQKRPKWDGRHHIVRQNDSCDPNTRCYFDRFVDRVKYPDCLPKTRLRPTFRLDCEPEDAKNPKVYRTWDAWHARWKEQWQWAEAADAHEQQFMGVAKGNRPKNRSPRRDPDLLVQRGREKEWDSKHHAVFSRANETLQVNYRSYFDRWKEDYPANPAASLTREPTWRLPLEKKPLIRRSGSEPKPGMLDRDKQRFCLPGQKAWNGNFNSMNAP